MASNKAERVAVNLDSVTRQMQNSLDLGVRTLEYIVAHGDIVSEITALPAATTVVVNDLTKERVVDLATLVANLAFFLRGLADGTNTVLGTAPLTAAQLNALISKLSI